MPSNFRASFDSCTLFHPNIYGKYRLSQPHKTYSHEVLKRGEREGKKKKKKKKKKKTNKQVQTNKYKHNSVFRSDSLLTQLKDHLPVSECERNCSHE